MPAANTLRTLSRLLHLQAAATSSGSLSAMPARMLSSVSTNSPNDVTSTASPVSVRRRTTLRTLQGAYKRGEPISMLTAYDHPTALHAERAGIDCVLVGDSLGMVVLGHRTTQAVTLSDILHHSRAVRPALENTFLVADLPFGSYEDPGSAAKSARVLVKQAGVDAVKLEGGSKRAHAIRDVVDSGIACMAHIGLVPQSVSALGGFRARGKTVRESCEIIDDAMAVQDAGAFAVVLECIPDKLAKIITDNLDIPTIGIGAGVHCSGQVLVYHDMLGVHCSPYHKAFSPKFAKRYASIGNDIHHAITQFNREVKDRSFPSPEYTPTTMGDEQFEQLMQYIQFRDASSAERELEMEKDNLADVSTMENAKRQMEIGADSAQNGRVAASDNTDADIVQDQEMRLY